MQQRWTERVPELPGHLATLREVAASDVDALFTFFRDPAVTAFMAPPPPTLAKFAGFVAWAHAEREKGRAICFGIVPHGMTAAVGILQIRSLDPALSTAEWGFVLGAHFWSTGLFVDAASVLVEFAFTIMGVDRLEARIALRNARAQAAVQKLGAQAGATFESSSPSGIPRDPEVLWTLQEEHWRRRAGDHRLSATDATSQIEDAVEAAERALHQRETPQGVEPYPLFLFDRRRRERE